MRFHTTNLVGCHVVASIEHHQRHGVIRAAWLERHWEAGPEDDTQQMVVAVELLETRRFHTLPLHECAPRRLPLPELGKKG